ncbi:MAG: hypothetical protein JSW58_09330 [Candidatus Latescibacterota bacterium]|nr:MAG: hypothetical protein JSW58_09330 [Candidatus Latescibacterota bacterium]
MSEPKYPPDVIDRAEALVSRIQGISSCRISTDETGEITEVHVVAGCQKSPKLVARDVETCLKAMAGIEVDHRKIGVVVFDSNGHEPAPSEDLDEAERGEEVVEFPVEEYPSRFEFQSVNLFISQESIQAEVELSRGGMDVFGSAKSTNMSISQLRIVAEATLKAVGELLDERVRLCLVEVQEVPLSEDIAILVKVDLLQNRERKSLAGCSLFSGNVNQTVVFATLDAVNRVLGKLRSRKSIEYRIK